MKKSEIEATSETPETPAVDQSTALGEAKAKLKEIKATVEAAKKAARDGKKEIKSLKKQIKRTKKEAIYKGKKFKKAAKAKPLAVVEGL